MVGIKGANKYFRSRSNMSLSLYPIIKKLGEGGFGTTYLATNTLMPSQPYCVVKQLTPTSTDPKVKQLIKDRFKQEAITLENLGKDSNGIPSLYAYFVEQGEFYLIQEYINGQTLNERVQTQGLFTEIQVRQLLTDILPTLVYVHQSGIVHRDVKPENIMIRHSDNKPILIDFGAVKETMSTMMTASGIAAKSIVIGTPGFMPIEQMSGHPLFASDIYALGLTAIYLLTGKMPIEIETDSYSRNINWQSLAPSVSPQLVEVLNKAIEPLPRDRYKNAQEMLQHLNVSSPPFTPLPTIISDIPIPIGSEKTVYVPTPKTISNSESSQVNPLIAIPIGVIVGCGLIGGFLLLGQNSSRKESNQNSNNIEQTVTTDNDSVTSSSSKVVSKSNDMSEPINASAVKNTANNTDKNSRDTVRDYSKIRSKNYSGAGNANNTDRNPRDTVRDYYSKINSKNYSGAWNALPKALQNDKSVHPNGYNSFLNWWASQVANVEVRQSNLVSQTDRDAVVDVDIKYLMRNGIVSPYLMRYFLVKDERTNDWVIQKIQLR